MTKWMRAVLIAVLLWLPGNAWAQNGRDNQNDDRPSPWSCFTVNAGGGYPAVKGTDGDNLSGQWEFQGGAGIQGDRFGVHVDYLHNTADVKTAALTNLQHLNPGNIPLLNATGGSGRFDMVAINPTFRSRVGKRAERRAEIYLFGGFGLFRRQVTFTGVTTEGAVLQPGNPSVLRTTTESGGVDGGGGVNFPRIRKNWPHPYLEVRVVRGLAINHATTLIPISVGIRW